ncbi:MAG: hypothetical protein DRP29_06970 [Thermodesulfobacteriota bacterium]|nr:MAG: hypothetical protein DRP29_06970 [Thermodesulfobacteriota bacterium]
MRKTLFIFIIFLIFLQINNILAKESKQAQPGDIIIRHRGKTFGFIGGIPHIGIYVGEQGEYNVVHLQIEKGKSIIKTTRWTDEKEFKDPGFYSILDGKIPVKFNGKIIPISDLPPEIKTKIRSKVCEIAKKQVGKVIGPYRFSQLNPTLHSANCGDWVLDIYDKALKIFGIQVMSHKIHFWPKSPDWWLKHPEALKPGNLKDYAEILKGTVDPSRLPAWFPEVNLPQNRTEIKFSHIHPPLPSEQRNKYYPFGPPPGGPSPPPAIEPKIGGVLLYKSAAISNISSEDIESGLIDPETGNFALIINGENVSLSDTYFKDFLSVLFAVYYGDKDPGISIDPICNDCERMLVRYIGKTRYTPMGKVLFDADRLMKCYWLGKDNITKEKLRPPIEGFKNAFETLREEGLYYLGAWVRFWFKPSVMRLKKCGNVIVFDEAKMGLYTEYLFKDKEALTEPSAQAYADFFTEHYDDFAKYNPVYEKLLEYAKMVAIAKYLKESGVPLGWLLQANIDRLPWVKTPDSTPALTVEDKDINIKIYGGVDYSFENTYIIDEETAKVIEKALAEGKIKITSQETPLIKESSLSTDTQSFTLEDKTYTIVPIKRLMKETSYKNLSFSTDFALFDGKDIILELIRYRHKGFGIFGHNWDILIPYRLKFSDKMINYKGVVLPEKVIVKDLIWGREEELIFSDKENILGYIPKDKEKSRFLILAITLGGTYHLADKLGNEFWFDEDGYMTDMIFSKKHHIHYEYLEINDGISYFEKAPYKIEPEGKYIKFLNAYIPQKVKLINLITGKKETFIFSPNKYIIAGYVPEDKESDFKFLAILSDKSFQLLDKKNREYAFDAAGNFIGMSAKVIKSISQEKYSIKFIYDFSKNGKLRVKEAKVYEKGKKKYLYALNYKYDKNGMLCKIIRPKEKVIKIVKITN